MPMEASSRCSRACFQLGAGALLPRLVQLLAQAKLQLSGGFVRERHRGDLDRSWFGRKPAPRRSGAPVRWSCRCPPTLRRSGSRRAIAESCAAPRRPIRCARTCSCHPPYLGQRLEPNIAPVFLAEPPFLIGPAHDAVVANLAGVFGGRGRQEAAGNRCVDIAQQFL